MTLNCKESGTLHNTKSNRLSTKSSSQPIFPPITNNSMRTPPNRKSLPDDSPTSGASKRERRFGRGSTSDILSSSTNVDKRNSDWSFLNLPPIDSKKSRSLVSLNSRNDVTRNDVTCTVVSDVNDDDAFWKDSNLGLRSYFSDSAATPLFSQKYCNTVSMKTSDFRKPVKPTPTAGSTKQRFSGYLVPINIENRKESPNDKSPTTLPGGTLRYPLPLGRIDSPLPFNDADDTTNENNCPEEICEVNNQNDVNL